MFVATGIEVIINSTFIVDGVAMNSSTYSLPFMVNNSYYQIENSGTNTGKTFAIPFGKNISFILYYTGNGSSVNSQYAVYYNEKIE